MPEPRSREKERCWRKRTKLEKTLIIGASVLGVVALIILLLFTLQESCKEIQEECSTKSCVKAAAELLEFVDLKVDPCKNFYKYACGSFLKNAVKKDTPSPWVSTRTLFDNEMKSLVVDPIGVRDSNAQILMKKFYSECMNTTKIEADGDETFMDALNELGGWPLINGTNWNGEDFNWADWYVKAKQIGLPVIGLFNFDRFSQGVLTVSGPDLELDDLYSSIKFKRIMRAISKAFGAPEQAKDYHDVHRFINELFKLRNELDSIVDDDDDDEYDENDKGDDNEDDDDDDDEDEDLNSTVANLTDICPNVPWLNILNGITGNSSQFDNSSAVHFNEDQMLKYCEKLDTLLKDTKPEVIANYYIWSIIHKSHKYLSRDVRRVYEDMDDEEDDRFKICYSSTIERFKYVRETEYIRRKTFPKVRKDLFEMIDIIKDLFIQHLKTCDWMDDATKVMALKKAKSIESIVGADDELYDVKKFDRILGLDEFNFTSDNIFKMYQQKLLKEDLSLFSKLDEESEEIWEIFFKNLVEVNAFFLPPANAMIIPAPILTSIFYNWKFPASMNYGAMGSTVAHEIMHGFSESSREYFDDDKNKTIDWWTNGTKEAYIKKMKCIIDEYESIPFRRSLNGTQTLEENLADMVGADIGYEAYQIWVKRHRTERKLAGVPLTPEQIYWVQTATNFCFRKLDDQDIDYEEEDEHGIPAFRVQGPARHSIHFAEAFNCPIGSFMNPEKKCKIL